MILFFIAVLFLIAHLIYPLLLVSYINFFVYALFMTFIQYLND